MLQNNDCKDYYDQNFKDIICLGSEIVATVFEECVFSGCNFSETIFKQCKFRYCKFINCNLSLIIVNNCSFLNVQFEECKIIGVNWTYVEALWPPIIFKKCNISQSNFLGLNLKEVIITECIVREADFRECDLYHATLTANDFKNSLFNNTNLTKADLTNATDYTINVLENKLHGAKFSLPEAVSLLNGIGIELS